MADLLLAAVTAVRAAQFLASLGVNTHLEYTDGGYADTHAVLVDLAYLGIHRLRDGIPNPAGGIPYHNYRAALDAAAAAGNRFDFIVGPGQPLATSRAELDALAAAHPGMVAAVEGPNEINNWPVRYGGRDGTAAAVAFQSALYAAIHGDPALAGIPVYYFTGGDRAATLAGLADDANTHPYPPGGRQPAGTIAATFAETFAPAAAAPRVITETGYFDAPANPDGSGVDDATQAKNTLNLLFDAFAAGVSVTYLYQLLSAYPDDGRNADVEYGLFRQDNTPKPVAVALHTLTSLLADTGATAATFTPGALACSVADLPATGAALLLQKSDGTFELALWAEPPDWDAAAHAPIAVPATTVTLACAQPLHRVAVFDPLAGGAVRHAVTNATRVRVALADHPVLVQIDAGR